MAWTFYNASGQKLSSAATNISVLDIDGATDIGADIVDADLFIIDDGAGGTNRKTAASRIITYVQAEAPLRSTEVEGSRTASAGAGAQAVTGAGFAPTAMFIFAVDKVSTFGSWGWGDDAAGEAMIETDAGSMTQTSGRLVTVNSSSAGNGMTAVLTSMDADGCTITWTKYSSGLDVHYIILFLR
jgi:hypothetical protein